MSANITFKCPGCSGLFSVANEFSGHSIICEDCNSRFIAPNNKQEKVTIILNNDYFVWYDKLIQYATLNNQENNDLQLSYSQIGEICTNDASNGIIVSNILQKYNIIREGKNNIWILKNVNVVSEEKKETENESSSNSEVTSNQIPKIQIKENESLWFLESFKKYINSNFLDGDFLNIAKECFNREKWQLHQPKEEIQQFFEKYQPCELLADKEFFPLLKQKLKITLQAKPALTKLVAKLHLILSIIYIESFQEKNKINQIWAFEFQKVLAYFIDSNDFLPDTSTVGYLDDLYVFILGFKKMRTTTKEKLKRMLKEVLDQ